MSERVNPFLIRVLPTLFTEQQRAALYEFLNTPGWETGWKSNNKRDGLTFLHKHFAGRRKASEQPQDCEEELKSFPLIYDAWTGVRERVFKNRTLTRCYANGMAYGMDGYVHTDASRPGSFTLVYYPHPQWSPNWGGETMFYTSDESTLVGAVYPTPNSAVLFDGRIPHRANAVTRIYSGVRITLMFKIEAVNETAAQAVSG